MNELTSGEIRQLMERLASWKVDDNRYMGDYVAGNCYPFLYRLYNIELNKFLSKSAHCEMITAKAPGFQRALLGPHGYTILRAAIARYEERLKEGHEHGNQQQGKQGLRASTKMEA